MAIPTQCPDRGPSNIATNAGNTPGAYQLLHAADVTNEQSAIAAILRRTGAMAHAETELVRHAALSAPTKAQAGLFASTKDMLRSALGYPHQLLVIRHD